MANGTAAVKVPLGMKGHSAYIALGDDELRRWETHCRGLEEGELNPWASEESRALVNSILSCLFGEDLSQLEMPARAWARTNSTMAIFTRRLGCLRELVGQESTMNGPDSFDRLQEIFDKVTIVAAEAALASLAYTSVAPHETKDQAPVPEAAVATSETDGARPGPQPEARSPWRRRILLTLIMAAIAGLVAALAAVLTSPSTVHRPVGTTKPVHTTSIPPSPTSKTTTVGSSASPVKGGAGSTGLPRSGAFSTSGGTSGVSRTGSTAGPGNTRTQNNGANTGSSGSSTPASPGGSTTVTVPGGAQVTVPQLTIP